MYSASRRTLHGSLAASGMLWFSHNDPGPPKCLESWPIWPLHMGLNAVVLGTLQLHAEQECRRSPLEFTAQIIASSQHRKPRDGCHLFCCRECPLKRPVLYLEVQGRCSQAITVDMTWLELATSYVDSEYDHGSVVLTEGAMVQFS